MRTYLLTTAAVGAIASFGVIGAARANPAGPTSPSAVVNAPTYTGLGTSNLQVNLNQSRTIIDWSSYNIASGDKTSYMFGANHNSWIVLNRVNSGSATINGTLQGCLADCTTFGGNIWIYASDGVVIGNGAVVNTGGFLATTSPLSTSDSDFANGTESPSNTFSFGSAASGSAVQIQAGASITGHGGTLAFIAPQVSTASGSTVTAPNGSGAVLYGAATSYKLQFAPDTAGDFDLITFDVPAGSAGGSTSTTPISLQGATKAGNVYVAAVTQSSVANAMISIAGTQTATQANAVGGDIVLSAGGGISNGQAAAPSGGAGGTVGATVNGTIQADTQVALNATGSIDASGAAITGSSTNANTTLTGSAAGGATITNASNQIGTVAGFANTGSGDVKITSSTAMDVTGAVNSGSGNINLTTTGSTSNNITLDASLTAGSSSSAQSVTLVSAGGIAESTGNLITTGTLTGSSAGSTSLAQPNVIGTLGAFQSGGDFSLTNAGPLIVTGSDVSSLGISGVTAGSGGTTGNLTLTTTGFGAIELEGNLTAASTSGTETVTLDANGSILQLSGVITANELTGSAGGVRLNDANLIGTLGPFHAAGIFTLKDAEALKVVGPVTVTGGDGGSSISLTTTSADLTIAGNLTTGGATGNNALTLTSAGAIEQTGGAITAGQLTTSSAVDTSLTQTSNRIGTLEASSAGGNFYLVDSSALTVAGSVNAGTGTGGVGNIFLEAPSITFNGTNPIDLTAGTNGLGSLQTDTLTVSSATTINATTFEYAPFTSGKAVTIGAGGVLPNANLNILATTIRIGAVTVPGTGLTTTAGSITTSGSQNDPATGLELDATTTGGGSGAVTIGGAITASSFDVNTNGSIALNGVTTTGAQTYGGAVTLGTNTALTGSTITFDSSLAGPYALNITGNASFANGSTANIGSLSVSGAMSFDGSLTTAGSQSYMGPVTLATDETLVSTSGSINFGSTIDGAHSLSVTAATGTVIFGGGVGSSTPLTSLIAEGFSVVVGGNVTTTGTTFLQGGNITFAGGTIDTLAQSTVSLQADTLTFNGAETVNTGTIEYAPFTAGTAVTLGSGGVLPNTNLNINATNGRIGAVTLPGTGLVTTAGSITIAAGGFSAGSANLELDTTKVGGGTGEVVVNGAITANALTVNAGGTITFSDGTDVPVVSTAAGQTYNGAVSFTQNATLEDTGSVVDFKGTVAGPGVLTITGNAEFDGLVGTGTFPLSSLSVSGTTDINTTNIYTVGGQTYSGAVTLGANIILSSNGGDPIDFKSTVAGGFSLTTNTTGRTTFGGEVGVGTPLSFIKVESGPATISTDAITTTGNQTYDDAVTLGASTTLASTGGGNITFNSVDGAFALTTETTGATLFYGEVGANNALSSLSVNGFGGTAGATALNGGSVTTTGPQTYNDAVTLGANTTLTSTGNATIDFGSTLDGAFSLTVNTFGTITFGGAVGGTTALTSLTVEGATDLNGGTVTTTGAQNFNNAAFLGADTTLASTGGGAIDINGSVNGAFALTVNTHGTATLGGLGGGTALTSLTVNDAGSGLVLDGPVKTTGAQDYNANVMLGSDATLTSTGGGAITFEHTLEGGHALTTNTSGTTTFDSAVGLGGSLTSLTVDGAAVLNAGVISTSQFQLYKGAVTLDATTSLSTGGGGNITFGSTLDGGFALSVLTLGTTSFNGAVGGTTALTSLDVPGATNLDGGTVKTTGAQTYGSGVALGADTTLTSTNGGAITFEGTVDGAFALTTNTTGATGFGGAVGGTTALTSLAVDGPGAINTDHVNTTGVQTYSGVFTLGANTTLTGSTVKFGSTLDGGHSIAIAGNAIFDNDAGHSVALSSVSVSGTTTLDGTVTTTGGQTYTNPVTLATDETFISTGGGAIVFDSTVDGGFALTTQTTGLTTFGGAVGGTTALASVTVDGASALNSGIINTTGAQSYSGTVTLGASDTLTSTNGAITFSSTVDSATGGPFGLVTTAAGLTTFDAAVGHTMPLLRLIVNDTAALDGGSVTTTTNQIYGQAATLGADATLTGTIIDFGSSLDGAHALTLDGNAMFVGPVGGTTNLTSVSVSGSTTLDGTITTSGDQTYTGAVTLDSAETLTSTAGNIDFKSTVDGGFALTANTNNAINTSTTFEGDVGATAPLASLTVNGQANLNDGVITTTGAQTYNGYTQLATPSLTLTSTGSGNITFAAGVDPVSPGSEALTIDTAGTTTFNVDAGNAAPFLSLTTGAAGNTVFEGSINVQAHTLTFNNPVTVEGPVTNFMAVGTGNVTFGSTLDGASAVTINSFGTTTFDGAVGGTTPLTSLTVDAISGAIDIAANITTTGDQIYGVDGTSGLVVPSGVTLDSTGGGITISGKGASLAGNLMAPNGVVLLASSTGASFIQTGGAITAAGLTVEGVGTTTLTSSANAIGALEGPESVTGAFTLTDSAPLAITGTLNATGQTVTLVDTGGGIDAHAGVIEAATLTGSAAGDVLFTDGSNAIGTLAGFTDPGHTFSLTDSVATLTITGTVDPTVVTLVNTGGGIDASGGAIVADQLNGMAAGNVFITSAGNQIGALTAFTVSGGNAFSLVDSQALTVSGTLSDLGGSTTLHTASGGITVTGTIDAQNLSFDSAAGIDESAGSLSVSTLNGTSASDATFTGNNQIAQLSAFNLTGGNFTLDDTTPLAVTGNIQAPANVFVGMAVGQGLTTDPGIVLASTGGGLVSIQADALTIGAGMTVTGSTFEYAPATLGNTVTLGSSATDLNNATLNVSTVRIGAVTKPGGSSPTTTSGAITIASSQDFGGDNVDFETTGAVTGTAGAITGVAALAGNAGSVSLSDSSNSIQTLGNFSTSGNFTLADSTNLSIKGALNAGANTVDLELPSNTLDENGGAGSITAGALTGNSSGATLNGQNRIATLGNFATNSGSFTLDNSVALSITGTLNAGDGSVDLELGSNALDEANGTGAILAASLRGTSGDATLTGPNSIDTLAGFVSNANDFSLIDTIALTITGTLDASDANVTLKDTGGGITAHAGIIIAGQLSGQTAGTAFFDDANNSIRELGTFTNTSGDLSLSDSTNLTIVGTVNVGDNTLKLVAGTSEGAVGIAEGEGGVIDAGTLTGSATGPVTLTSSANTIGTLSNFTDTGFGIGNFSLTDNAQLTIIGTLNIGGNTLALTDLAGGIDASGASINAGILTGSTAGNADFTGASNTIYEINSFTNTSGSFSLNDTVSQSRLNIYGTFNAAGQIVTLDVHGGGIVAFGTVYAGTLTGSADGDIFFTTPNNQIGTLGSFADTSSTSHSFTLTDSVPLTISGTISMPHDGVGFNISGNIEASGGQIDAAGITANSSGTIDFTNPGNQIGTLVSVNDGFGSVSVVDSIPLVVSRLNTPGQTVSLVDTGGGIDESNGTMTVGALTGSSTGDAIFTGAPIPTANAVGTVSGFTNTSGDFSLTDNIPLAVTGTLNAAGHTVTLNINGGIDASGGAIDAATLTGYSLGSALFTNPSNDIGTLTLFANVFGAFSLVDNKPLTITGPAALTATGQTVTLVDTGGGIDASGGQIVAATLTGSSTGNALFTNTSNAIGTLAGFTNTSGSFSLTDSIPLAITGTLNASGQTVTLVDTGGGIDASAAPIDAGTLTGTVNGDALFTNPANAISIFANFTDNVGSVSLVDNVALTILGTIDPTVLNLVDTGGGIDASGAALIAQALTGSTAGNAVFTNAGNVIGTLNNFTNTQGSFSLTDSVALKITGTLNVAGNAVTLVDTATGAPVTIPGDEETGSLVVSGTGIDASQGQIIASSLTGSSTGSVLFTDASNQIGTLAGFTNAAGAVSLTDSVPLTITGTINATGQTLTLVNSGGGIDASGAVIEAATLTGSTTGNATFTDSANAIGTLAGFTDKTGTFSLTDSVALTITGTIDPTVLTLVDTGGGIDASAAAIDAGTLTGSTAGAAVFTNAGNNIGTLSNFTNTAGAFSLTDSVALTITGTLNAAGQTVTLVDTGGGINASAGVIDAATLTGSTTGGGVFTDGKNAIGTLAGFTNTGGDFSLTDSTSLAITSTLNATGHTVTLVDTGGNITASTGVIDAATLTGSTTGNATFTGNNTIGTLDAFQAGGSFSLTDIAALAVTGTDISSLGFTGVTAGHGGTKVDLTVTVNGASLTLASNMTAGATGGTETLTLSATGGITENGGTLTAGTVALSSGADIARNNGAIDAGSATLTAAGNITQTGGTLDATTLASLTATTGNIIINGGEISSGGTVALTAGQNIVIGEAAFTNAALGLAPSAIDQVKTPILPINVDGAGNLYEATAPYHNYVFITTQTLDVTAPGRIVSENTGTIPATAGGYKPNGIAVNQTATPLPAAILIDGGPGGSLRPQVVDLFGTLMQGPLVVGAQEIADSAQVLFGPDTNKNNAYGFNGCVIHNLNSCTVVNFTIKMVDPAKQTDLVIIPNGDPDTDELDLTISGAGNDEIWEDEE